MGITRKTILLPILILLALSVYITYVHSESMKGLYAEEINRIEQGTKVLIKLMIKFIVILIALTALFYFMLK